MYRARVRVRVNLAPFILPANAKRMLTPRIHTKKFAAVQLCSTYLRISCERKDVTSNSRKIRIAVSGSMNQALGFIGKGYGKGQA